MKSLKKTMFYSMIVTVLILSYWIYSCLNFSLSNENDFTLIQSMKPYGKNYTLCLYYSPSDATIQSSIQLYRVYDESPKKLIQKFDKYNSGKFEVLNDSIKIRVIDSSENKIYAEGFFTIKLD